MRKLLFILCLATFAGDLLAANINIGPNGCSLADAIRSANSNSSHGNCAAGSGTDFIIAPDNWVVTLNSELPTITSNVTLRSSSPAGLFYISGNNAHRVLKITGSNTNVTLNRVQISEGKWNSDASGIDIKDATVRLENSIVVSNSTHNFGAAIYVLDGDLTIDHSLVQGNGGDYANAGLWATDSRLQVIDSSFIGNTWGGISFHGGDVLVENSLFDDPYRGISGISGSMTIGNSTFVTSSQTNYRKYGVYSYESIVVLNHITGYIPSHFRGGELTVSNSFIYQCDFENDVVLRLSSNNLFHSGLTTLPPNCLGLTADNYLLAPLADNGGPTKTIGFLSPDSAAINAGDPAHCQVFDQRGELRDSQCDVGAYEANPSADVEVDSRTEPAPPFASNQQITYYAEITNNGPDIADDVAINIDPDFAYIGSFDSPFCDAVDCVISSIQPGQTLVIPVRMTLASYFNSPFQIDLSAHTSADSLYTDVDEDDPGTNNTNVISYAINAAADLAIDMDLLTSDPYGIGQTVNYEATITNHGPQTASGVALEFLPDNLNTIVFSGCASVVGNVCSVANIASGNSRTVDIQAVISAAEFNAVATVSSGLLDVDTSNNTDYEQNGGGINKSDIQIQLSVIEPAPYTSLQYIQFRILIAAGEEPATNIRLYYEFPGAEYINIDGCADYPCVIPNLAAHAEIELTARFFAPLAIPGIIDTWSMRVLALPGQFDQELGNNEETIVLPLKPVADVASQLNLVSQPPFYAGQEIQYSLRVVNAGPNAVTKVDVGLQRQNLSLVFANGELCPTVDCMITRLNAFDEENITLVYRIDDIGTFDLISMANANEIDNNATNNTDDTSNGGVALEPPPAVRPNEIFSGGFEN